MPLYMDLHKASDYEIKPTVDEIRRNHIADLQIQHRYGVTFLQYWINEEAGLVFCLMEAPDKESCAAVHREAHGAMPCNVIELKGGDYSALIDEQTRKNQFDIVERTDGTMDPGYRVVMAVDFLSVGPDLVLAEVMNSLVETHGGHLLHRPGHRAIIVFMPGNSAAESAADMIHHIQTFHSQIEVRIGISAGTPVTDRQELFADAIGLANKLCDIAPNGQVLMSSMANELTRKNWVSLPAHEGKFKILNLENEQFLIVLTEAIASLLPEASLHIDALSKRLGMSRSGLYRKIKELTGSSANNLIQEIRLQKALYLMKTKYGNITQVALEAGFNNLSYFSKTFENRFGVLPLKAAKLYS